MRISVTTDRQSRDVAGTLFGEQPRVVSINEVSLEAALTHTMLYITNDDKPGMIGGVGKLLGDAGINITNFHLGRNESAPEAHEAIALLAIDQPAGNEVLESLGGLESVNRVKLLRFE